MKYTINLSLRPIETQGVDLRFIYNVIVVPPDSEFHRVWDKVGKARRNTFIFGALVWFLQRDYKSSSASNRWLYKIIMGHGFDPTVRRNFKGCTLR